MAYLSPDFQHDLFVSYSHGDLDGIDESPWKDWSATFVHELSLELQQISDFRGRLGIFLDQDHRPGRGVDPTASLTDLLRDQIAASALLAIVVAPHYFRSTWCRSELEWWQARHGADLASSAGRILAIQATPTDDREWPRSLVDEQGNRLPGFSFHPRGQDPETTRPYRWKGLATEDDRVAYQRELMNVVTRVKVRLREMRAILDQRARQAEAAEQLARDSGQVLYLFGHERDSVQWSAAYEELSRQRYTVVPTEPEPETVDPQAYNRRHRERVKTLAACDAMLLLTAETGAGIDTDLVAVGRKSRHAAKALSEKLLPCAVFDTVGTTTRTPRILQLARDLGIHWIDAASGPDWATHLRAWLLASGRHESIV